VVTAAMMCAGLAVTQEIPLPAGLAVGPPGQPRYVVQLTEVQPASYVVALFGVWPGIPVRPPGHGEPVLHSRPVVGRELALQLATEWSGAQLVRAGRQRVKVVAVSGRAAAQLREASRPPAPDGDNRGLTGLVMDARVGDVDAYGVLYRRTGGEVFAFLRGRRSAPLAEALTAEVYQAGLRQIRGADLADPVGWLLRIADGLAPDQAPAHHRRPVRLAGLAGWAGRLWHRIIPGHAPRAHTTGGY
jgi:hypothetical protein